MIKGRTQPRRRAVALLTGLRESGLHVVWLRRALKILQVAADARGVRAAQGVVVVDVALRALHRRVRARQREARRGMIKVRTRPRRGVVALLTGLRERGLHVIGLCRPLEIFQVAADASGIRAGQVVIAIHVALRALHRRVRPGQREASRRVVKCRVIPRGRAVALLAGRREPRLHVVRIGRAVEVFHVARGAVGGSAHKLAIDVALRAGDRRMRARQWELGKGIVIERCLIPRSCVVTCLASIRESGLRVRRVIGLIKVRQVAADAGCRRSHKLAARVAGAAVQGRVGPGQRESRELQVIELRAHPVVHAVALFAGGRQIQGDVIDADRLRINKVLLVAGETLG